MKSHEFWKQFIEDNYIYFSNLKDIKLYKVSDFEKQYIEYLKIRYRFDHKDICVCYSKMNNKVWVENMSS
jgi:hypothetical protein